MTCYISRDCLRPPRLLRYRPTSPRTGGFYLGRLVLRASQTGPDEPSFLCVRRHGGRSACLEARENLRRHDSTTIPPPLRLRRRCPIRLPCRRARCPGWSHGPADAPRPFSTWLAPGRFASTVRSNANTVVVQLTAPDSPPFLLAVEGGQPTHSDGEEPSVLDIG
ncbi:hypothetical protein PYCCODRAFT_1110455 [Trametes coccinea BRFM310]|uniref:Uncharacterized protein n=1 Tax=Trametes coccinea (strain BRFM310) TaxID=1353009 RepID=A0A1Y2I992_TRAC3|nr:hypothetical protein PYCCODRAFT_1110455 [Trametes coccinea BRFM310]